MSQDYYQYWYGQDNGLGFLPVVAAAPVIAGPIAGTIGGAAAAIGAFFGRLFGGDDQATSYRPPPDSAAQFVHIADQFGDDWIAYNVDAASLAVARSRGNRDEDIFSYYSGFLSNSAGAGASEAAARVMQDAANKNGVSIARAADWLLTTAGIQRIVQGFRPSSGGGGGATGGGSILPPYCPGGTYHPFPIGHPQQDLCVPFPDLASGGGQPSQGPAAPPRQAGGGAQFPAGQVSGYGLPYGQQPDPCAAGLRFNPNTGRCEQAGGAFSFLSASIGGIPLWLIILLLIIASQSGGNGRGRR